MANEDKVETVTVACKLPNGLRLRLFQAREVDYPMMGGGFKRVKEHHPTGEEIVINGNSYPQDQAPRVPINDFGYALTRNVSKKFMDEWMKQNEKNEMVLKKIIIVHSQPASIEAETRENEKRVTGFERIDPERMPKEFKRVEKSKAA